MRSETREFDLVTARWKENARFARRYRLGWLGGAVFFAVLGIVSLIASLRAYSSSTAVAVTGLSLMLAMLWFFVVTLFQVLFVVGTPPNRLRVTPDGVELVYDEGKVRYRKQWTDPGFALLLRDFRGWASPMSQDIVLDTGDHRVVKNLLPSRTPPSAYLTSEAFEAVKSAASEHNLQISSRKEEGMRASPGWMWPDVATRIAPGPNRSSRPHE